MTESKPPQNDRETLHVGRVAAWRTAAVRSSYVAAVFIALVALLLLWDFSGRLVKDPLDSDAYRQLRGQLAGSQVQLFDENGDMIAALIHSGDRFIGTLAGGQGISMAG